MQEVDTGRHEYRMRGWQRGVYLLLGVFIFGAGIFIVWTLGSPGKTGAALLLAVVPLALGLWLSATAVRSRLVIEGTRIEVRGACRAKSAELGEVEGFRTITTRNGSFWRLQRKEGLSSITIQKSFDCDQLRAWFRQLTDLDEQDRKVLLDQIEQSEELGATPEDRLAKLGRARRLNIALSGVAAAAAFGFGLGGDALHVPAAIVLAALPAALVYLVRREPLLYAVFKPKRDPRTDLCIAFMACGLGLILGNADLHFVELVPLLEYAGVVGLLCCAGIFAAARRNPQFWGAMFGMLFVAGAYGYGLAATADTVLDQSTPAGYAATVQGKHVSHGRSTSYHLDLAPWGPMQWRNDVSVGYGIYKKISIGEVVCLEVHPGLLRVRWYRMVACAGQ
jgi:uncharacterized membrane protein